MENPVRILVVEDSASQLFIYRRMLSDSGFEVFEASTGAAALDLIQRVAPDILLLDRVLPDFDGSEICARVKTDPATSEIYVIMISGLMVSEDDRVSGLEAGADDYVLKPVGRRELLARIQVALRLRSAMSRLRTSELQFRTLIENSPDYIARLQRDGEIRYLNPAAQSLFAEGEGKTTDASDFTRHLVNDESLSTQAQAVFRTGQSSRIKSMLRHGDEIHHLDTRLVPEFGSDGRVASILAVTRDYTDFVMAEQEIHRLATVVRQSVDAVQITDPQGRIIYTNAAYTQLIGLDGEDVLGKELPGYPYICPEHRHCRLLDHLADGKERWQGLVLLERGDGEQRTLETMIFSIRDADGQVTNFAALQRDVTERRQAEEEREVTIRVAAALRTAITRREVLAATLDQLMLLSPIIGAVYVGIDSITEEALIESVRGVSGEFLYTRLSLAGTATEDVFNRHEPVMLTNGELRRLTHFKMWPSTLRFCAGVPLKIHEHIDGVLWIGASAPIPQSMLYLFMSLADILANSLERANLYEATRRYADELEQRVVERTQELAQANEQLRELDRLKSKFVSNVSHELRTPIANLKLYLNLLERGNEKKRPHYEAMLRQSADRLGQLVQDILSLSRLEIAQLQPREFAETDLNAVVSQAVQHFEPQAEAAGLGIFFEAAAGLPLISGDFNQLAQLVTNLISNALTYTNAGHVQISTFCELSEPPCVHLIVEDTGVGIHPEDIPYVFERFYRGTYHEGQDIPGTGLGLAIVREIVTIHQGQIDLSSEVGKGTKIDVILPCQIATG